MAGYDDYAKTLEALRRIAPDDTEFWMARDLQKPLGYERWEYFADVLMRAMEACAASDVPVANHFRETPKMVSIGSGAQRATDDWFLSRYACYIIAMNGDSSKDEIAYAQTYFAIQTRIQEQQNLLTDVERRRQMRDRVKDANKGLNDAAQQAGVEKFGVFHSYGYRGLYGDLGKADIQARKGISAKDDLLDCIGHTELAANYFRITQTQQKLTREGISGQRAANDTHYNVGKEVRATMERISQTRPEDLPAEPSLKKLGAKKTKTLKPLEGGGLLDEEDDIAIF